MTIQEVKSFIEENKNTDDVKNFLTETYKSFLATDDGAKLVDSVISKAVKSYEEKTLPGKLPALVDAKVKELYPEMTPEQKQLKEVQAELERMKKEALKEKLLNKALTVATEKGLPTQLIDKFLGDDEQSTINNIETLSTIFNEYVQKSVDVRLPELGRTPTTNKKTDVTQTDLLKMSSEDFAKHAPEIKLV